MHQKTRWHLAREYQLLLTVVAAVLAGSLYHVASQTGYSALALELVMVALLLTGVLTLFVFLLRRK
jgi:hypothetical protein